MSSARVQFNPIDQHFTDYETVLTLAEAARALTLRGIISLGFACFFRAHESIVFAKPNSAYGMLLHNVFM